MNPLNDKQRINLPAKLFGIHFPLRVEPFLYDLARSLSPDYRGGYWHMYQLDNGGFYMAPNSKPLRVSCPNGFEGTLSGDAFGITVCLYTYSELSFSDVTGLAETCAEQYHRLRLYMLEHGEKEAILAAID